MLVVCRYGWVEILAIASKNLYKIIWHTFHLYVRSDVPKCSVTLCYSKFLCWPLFQPSRQQHTAAHGYALGHLYCNTHYDVASYITHDIAAN